MLSVLLLFAAVGILAGLVAGLFGLGGGVVMVPALIYTFTALSFPGDILTHLAVGTSLTCIVVTSTVSAWTHWQKGGLDRSLLMPLVPGVVVGAWIGGVVAAELEGPSLQTAFAIFLLFVSFTMFRQGAPDGKVHLPGRAGLLMIASVIGLLSSLFGVGGGSMTVPFLRFCKVAMARAVATSAALGLPIAISGSVSYLIQGWGHAQLPDGALGFVYVPAFLGLVVCSAPASRVGAKWAHRLPARRLQQGFALALLLIAVHLLVNGMMATQS